MAQRRDTRTYSTYGNVAYQPEERQSAVRAPREEPRRRPRPAVQPRRRPVTRPDAAVRAPGAVAPFAVVGFLAVALCALFLVMTTAELAMVGDETVDLRSTLSDLQDEERTLRAQYELTFDLAAIEEQFTADGSMVRASSGQMVYLDLSDGDSVTYYDSADTGLSALLRRAEQFLDGLLS